MHFLDPRVHALLPSSGRAQLVAYLNLVVAQSRGKGETMQPQRWFAERLAVSVRTVQRWERALVRAGALAVEHARRLNRRAVYLARGFLDRLVGESRHGRRACTATDVGTLSDPRYRERARASGQETSTRPPSGVNGAGRYFVPDRSPRTEPPLGFLDDVRARIRAAKARLDEATS